MPCRTFVLAGPRARTSHLVEKVIDRFAEMEVPEQLVYRMTRLRSLAHKDGAITKLELDDSPCLQPQLFAQLDRYRELSL